jgi:hypothetical protein
MVSSVEDDIINLENGLDKEVEEERVTKKSS